jgi:hypothetical protein
MGRGHIRTSNENNCSCAENGKKVADSPTFSMILARNSRLSACIVGCGGEAQACATTNQ